MLRIFSNFYNIVKKYVTINSKEDNANMLLSIIFLHFTMKSLPNIVFYFRWRMLEDSVNFKFSSVAPLKGKKVKNINQ